MGKLLLREREIVTPGEQIAIGLDFLPSSGTFREGEAIFANRFGLLEIKGRVLKVIPLAGKYLPVKGDLVVGIVTEMGFSGWMVDIGAPTLANMLVGQSVRQRIAELTKADISRYYDLGDIIYAKILNVTKAQIIHLTMRERGLRKLRDGRVITAQASKVPRIIGKQGSMIQLIKQATKCDILVGQNGYVWISGPPKGQLLAEKAIRLIEREAHTSGLTDKVKELLAKKKEEVGGAKKRGS